MLLQEFGIGPVTPVPCSLMTQVRNKDFCPGKHSSRNNVREVGKIQGFVTAQILAAAFQLDRNSGPQRMFQANLKPTAQMGWSH